MRAALATALLATALLATALLAASLPAAADTAAVARGERLYERCAACHSLDRDRTGPRHCGLFGRPAGAIPGFEYSRAMRASGIVWSERTLDRFLAAPMSAVPGTSMGYAGIEDAGERRDLIAYLKAAGSGPACP